MTANRTRRVKLCAQRTALGLILVLGLALGGSCKPKPAPPMAPVTMAVGMMPLASLAIIADHEKFFAREGVPVTLGKHATGMIALDALLAGDAQVALAGDTPVMFRSFRHQDFRIVAGVASWDNDVVIVARKDRGITRPADLKGKRIASQQSSVVQFFLHLFLLKHGLSEKDATICYMPQAGFSKALASGDVDASPIREPFASQTGELMGTNTVTFEEPGLYVEHYSLVASDRFLKEQPEAARRIVRALIAAEAFAKNQPQRAMELVAGAVSMPEPALRRFWSRLDLRVRLSQSLLVAMEDQARWAMGDHLVEEPAMPNFLRLIHLDALLAEKPSAVSIIR